jgi:hypothetical protein
MDDREERFCAELTKLLLKHGLGIADEPHVFDLTEGLESHHVAANYDRKASIDDEGRLQFV